MSVYSYLVNPKKKAFFELGKDMLWREDFSIFKLIESDQCLIENNPFEENLDIDWLLIDDGDILKLMLIQHFNSWNYEPNLGQDLEYIDLVTKKILEFCDDDPVAILNDHFETYYELKREFGYEITDSRYV